MEERAVQTVLRCYPQIFFACHQTHRRDPATRRVLSAHQASILDHLDARDPLSLKDLAGHMGVTPGTMSLAIDRLEAKGYVRRTRDPADARRVELRLTKAGVRMKDAGQVLEPARVAAMLEQLPPHEREAALEGLRLLAHAAEELIATAGRGVRAR